MEKDTILGMVFSNVVTMCIVLTTAATLHANGIFTIETPQQAAMVLKPLAGNFAFLLFTMGIIGIGLQSIPVFAGGIAYALSESFGLAEGLGKKFGEAKVFYGIIACATLLGALMSISGMNPIRALYYAAIINGIISVPLIAIIIRLADDTRVVGTYRSSRRGKIIAWITFAFVGCASLAMLYNLFFKG